MVDLVEVVVIQTHHQETHHQVELEIGVMELINQLQHLFQLRDIMVELVDLLMVHLAVAVDLVVLVQTLMVVQVVQVDQEFKLLLLDHQHLLVLEH